MYSSKELLQMVEEAIAALPLEREPKGLYEPIRYVLSLGGKRIRPVLMLMAYNLYREDVKPCLMQAIGIETYHNFTLLHDDLMDRAEVRRGKTCVHLKWNDNTAILSGDKRLVLAFQYMMQCEDTKMPAVMRTFSRTAIEIDEGQQYDVDFETRNDVTEAEYIEMIRLKTSVLLACALQIGATLADAPEQDAEALYRFGENLGLAFQLQDDYLDVYGDPAIFGKKIGGDILCNKKTFMLINTLSLCDETQRKDLQAWIDKTEFVQEEKIKAVKAIYDAVDIKTLCKNKMQQLYDEGFLAFSKVSVEDSRKTMLKDYVEQLMGRNY